MDQTTVPPAKPRPESATGAVRAHKPRKLIKRYIGANGFKSDVATLRGEGMTQRGVAQTLGVNQSTIARVEKLPEVAERIAELRKLWSDIAHTRITDVAGKAWEMTEKFIDQKDAKSFDNSMRGLAAMEKISASVAGAPQRVQVDGIPASDARIEIKAIFAKLFPNEPADGALTTPPAGSLKP